MSEQAVKTLRAVGLKKGNAGDILLSRTKQFKFISYLNINLKKRLFDQYQGVVIPNDGYQVFNSPIMAYSNEYNASAISLQLGIFVLLKFRNLIPLLPKINDKAPSRVALNLFVIEDNPEYLEKLVRIYKVEGVYKDYLKMQEAHQAKEGAFLNEYFRKKSITRKANTHLLHDYDNSSFLLEEVYDEELYIQYTESAAQQPATDVFDPLDPWARAVD